MDTFAGEKGSYKLGARISSTSRNSVYLCEPAGGIERYVVKYCGDNDNFLNELSVLKEGCSRLPKLVDQGRAVCRDMSGREVDFIVMDKCGVNLQQCCCEQRRFSLRSALQTFLEMVQCLEQIAAKSIYHNDLKLEQFCLATGKNGKRCVKLIDFDYSRRFTFEEFLKAGTSDDDEIMILPYLDLEASYVLFKKLAGNRQISDGGKDIDDFVEGLDSFKSASRKEILSSYKTLKTLIKNQVDRLPKEPFFPVIIKGGQSYKLTSVEPIEIPEDEPNGGKSWQSTLGQDKEEHFNVEMEKRLEPL